MYQQYYGVKPSDKNGVKKPVMGSWTISNVFRFLDDLIAINDWKEFGKCFKNIYPIELDLGKENSGDRSATFLDLHVLISDKKFQIDLYDKRDGSPFSIVRLPYLQTNLPAVIFYSSVSAGILKTHFTAKILIF